ncbi:MAG: putative zinc-binding metallopeptidase [Verrucomicrobiota bacterium]
MTEHDHGLITLSLAEADDAQREKLRTSLKEPYRTLLGHFRHESGHYYWDRLVLTNEALLGRFRELFGDERQDYDAALKAYYASGPPPNWGERFISLYATMHPWEDWAESWAHYLHVQDTLEVASDFGLVGRRVRLDPVAATAGEKGTLKPKPFDEVMDAWTELTVALNCLNRSMGLRDLYPFVLSSR